MRTIPTRVGKTNCGTEGHSDSTDHPHAGGENAVYVVANYEANGPSPRGWGKLERNNLRLFLNRTIPTRVGKTSPGALAAALPADHPHAGGENHPASKTFFRRCGPSPRGWGKPGCCRWSRAAARTIPTRVGKTLLEKVAANATTDHPHAGGENGIGLPSWPAPGGPSPRGWGKPPFLD